MAGPSGRRDPASARYTRGKAKSGQAADCLLAGKSTQREGSELCDLKVLLGGALRVNIYKQTPGLGSRWGVGCPQGL